jgi:hypothetical protein
MTKTKTKAVGATALLLGSVSVIAAIWRRGMFHHRPALGATTIPSIARTIAAEARTPEEYARRIEAWNSTLAQPLSITLLAKIYRGAPPGVTARLIREARERRLEQRERLWTRLSTYLHGRT